MKKNLILISLDTLRADVGYSGKFPTIESLRKKSVSFLNTVSSAPITPISHASVFTGLQPYNHGVRHLFKEKLNPKHKTLSELLKKQGYDTAAIVSCPGMNKWYGLSKGFDYYNDEISRLPDGTNPLKTVDVKKRGSALKRADIVVEKAKEWFANRKSKKPFFLFLHFFDTHWPYEAPEIYGGNNIYEQEVAFADYHLGKFFEYVKSVVNLDNTTIVCFSDHGEDLEGLYLNDKGGKKLGHPEESGHGCLLYDQTQKVILTFNDKSLPKNKEIERQVRLVDLTPTVLDLLGVKTSSIKFDGVSLLSVIKGRNNITPVAYSETFYPEEQNQSTNNKYPKSKNKKSIRIDNKYKVIFHMESDMIEVYDLEKDLNEQNNLFL
ncbi:sulfatase [Candidatus Gracilibacteria bacterium]|jgi:arylsulfatase A-like enzyme|nr:sulfatase [Candidatus Gracilibacteria bacterium]